MRTDVRGLCSDWLRGDRTSAGKRSHSHCQDCQHKALLNSGTVSASVVQRRDRRKRQAGQDGSRLEQNKSKRYIPGKNFRPPSANPISNESNGPNNRPPREPKDSQLTNAGKNADITKDGEERSHQHRVESVALNFGRTRALRSMQITKCGHREQKRNQPQSVAVVVLLRTKKGFDAQCNPSGCSPKAKLGPTSRMGNMYRRLGRCNDRTSKGSGTHCRAPTLECCSKSYAGEGAVKPNCWSSPSRSRHPQRSTMRPSCTRQITIPFN